MFGITHFAFFVFAVFLLNVTPGPDTAYIVGRSVAQGRGAGLGGRTHDFRGRRRRQC